MNEIIKPGTEPENIKKRIKTLFEKLDGAYPDKHIVGLHNEHKKWGETVTDLYRKLGYPDGKSFLEAYGYTYANKINTEHNGRPSNNHQEIINQIKEKYPNGSEYSSLNELMTNIPELSGKIKTLRNKSQELFGMTLSDYFLSIGILKQKEKPIKEVKKQKYNICKVKLVTNNNKKFNCILKNSGYSVGDYVEFEIGNLKYLATGIIEEIIRNVDEDSISNITPLNNISSIIPKKDYYSNKLKYHLKTISAENINNLIEKTTNNIFIEENIEDKQINGKLNFACCRGLATDILEVVDYLVKKDDYIYNFNDILLVDNNILEFYIYTDDITEIMNKFPNIKMVMFLEVEETSSVELLYSRSGYNKISDYYTIGKCNLYIDTRWSLNYLPTNDFTYNSINYKFKYKDDWENINYVYIDNNGNKLQIGGEINE